MIFPESKNGEKDVVGLAVVRTRTLHSRRWSSVFYWLFSCNEEIRMICKSCYTWKGLNLCRTVDLMKPDLVATALEGSLFQII